MSDLARFYSRVNAAHQTDQCRDYVEDVSELLTEVERLRSGIAAAQSFYADVYQEATNYRLMSYDGLREKKHAEEVAAGMLDALFGGMGPGWLP